MQMCWQASPGNRASLRELRIMLLHLHSASRGDPDTTSFDQKWNQLMPRQVLPSAEDISGNSPAHGQTVVDVVDIDLGTPGANSARPVVFESDFLEVNTSSNHIRPLADDTKSPVNEMSLAAELGALGASEAPCGVDDGDTDTRFIPAENSHASTHISVLAEIHSEKSDYMQQPADSLDVPLAESIDITDQFASLNAESTNSSAMSQTERYASYLKTVNMSAIEGDEDVADDPYSKDSVLSESA